MNKRKAFLTKFGDQLGQAYVTDNTYDATWRLLDEDKAPMGL